MKHRNEIFSTIVVGVACLLHACASVPPEGSEGPPLTPEEEAALETALETASGKADGFGLFFYQSEYVNLTIAGESDAGTVALVAGSHSADFPYFGTDPWDNGLLLVGDEGYHFTQRRQGEALTIDVNLDASTSEGRIRYSGAMVRVSDGEVVDVSIDLPVSVVRFDARQLGKPYVFLDVEAAERIPGMRWQPYELRADEGRLDIGGTLVAVSSLHGGLEHGVLANLRAPDFAFAYDYVSLAAPGAGGYGFVDFTAHSLYPETALGYVIDWYMVRFASVSLTFDDGLEEGNLNGVIRPSQDDASVLLFENEVDLGLATMRRQMIRTTDASGVELYGLREIFEPSP